MENRSPCGRMSAFPFWQAEAGLACEESELWRLGKPPATDRPLNRVRRNERLYIFNAVGTLAPRL